MTNLCVKCGLAVAHCFFKSTLTLQRREMPPHGQSNNLPQHSIIMKVSHNIKAYSLISKKSTERIA
jgi:hypothetical protein